MKLYRIKKSDIDKKGRGLYATKDIKEGTKIIDYIGKLITKKQTEESDKYDNSKPIYLFTVNKRYDLDGDFSWNTARLINHSCSNNCDYDGKGLKLWVKAIKDIKKGEELTCDYGFGYDENYKQFPCKCKSKNCCGYIVRAESRWRINKKFKKDIIDRKRISIILRNISKKSKNKKIDPKITHKIWKSMISAFIDYEYRNFKRK